MSRLLAALLLLALPGASRAQSPRWGSFELDAGPYRPDVDSEFTASPGPYQQIFGSRRGWMFRAGLSRALWTRMGSVEAGLRTGYFQASGKGFTVYPGSPTPTYVPSGDATVFHVIPTSATLTYRFDWIAERYPVPLAPYARVSLERYNWWITKGNGGTTKLGATNGWSATIGLAFLLDILDRQTAREFDQETGVNHTYLFADLTKSRVDDFGSSRSWDLSDEGLSFAFGLLFVF